MIVGSLEPRLIRRVPNEFVKKKLEIIDMCGGTGDIAFKILELSKGTRYYRNGKCKIDCRGRVSYECKGNGSQ